MKKISYWIECKDSFGDRKLALSLFDFFGFKKNIMLFAFRAYSENTKVLELFKKKISCKIIKDVIRTDSFCIIIPQLQSNLQLLDLIEAMDIQTEWTYIPLVDEVEALLFNIKQVKNKGAVRYKLSIFEAFFDSDFGLTFTIDSDYFELNKVNTIFKNWEETFHELKFKKILK